MSLLIKNVSKSYADKQVLDDFSAELDAGIYGLLGENGAGKSTLIKILVGLVKADRGEIYFNGENVVNSAENYLSHLGYLPQAPLFYKNFSAWDFLIYMAAIKDVPRELVRDRICLLLEKVNLTEHANKKIGEMSGGMLQRLGIAQAMLNDPDILILDEPTAGLDPYERIRFRNIVSRFSKDRIVILATHIVSDVEFTAQEVILLKSGKRLAQDTSVALAENVRGKVWLLNIDETELADYSDKYIVANILRKDQNRIQLRLIVDKQPTSRAEPAEPNLEDVFLYYNLKYGVT